MMLSSVGLPALNGFVGEFLILIGSFQVNWLLTLIATSGVILAAIYLLYMFRRMFYGQVTHDENAKLPDLNAREVCSVLPLAVMAFVIGLFPTMFLGRITPDTRPIVEELQQVDENRAADTLALGLPGLNFEIADVTRMSGGGS